MPDFGINTDSRNDVIIDELLCFLQNKLDLMTTDNVVRLCVDSFNEEEVKSSKKILFNLCGDDSIRNVSRRNEKAKEKNIEDMLTLMHIRGEELPTFVAKDLGRLPPISFESIDVSLLLTKIEKTSSELNAMKVSMSTQHANTELLKSVVCDLESRITVAKPTTTSEPLPVPVSDPVPTTVPTTVLNTTVPDITVPATTTSTTTVLAAAVPASVMPTAAVTTAASATVDAATYADKLKDQQGEGGWTVRRKKRSVPVEVIQPKARTSRGITGKARDSGIQTVAKQPRKRFANVFATRFAPDVTANCLEIYLKEQLQLDLRVVTVKTRHSTYASFHITSVCTDPSVFMKDSLWPEDTFVRWWREPKTSDDTPSAAITNNDESEIANVSHINVTETI